MNAKCFVFKFPHSHEWTRNFISKLFENGKPYTIYYEEKKEQSIQSLVKKTLMRGEYSKNDCFYVFFANLIIFCQKREYVCFANFLNCDDIDYLYEAIKPEITPRIATLEELAFINQHTTHRLDYDYKCDKDLIASVIQLAVEDAFLYKFPRSRKKATQQYMEIVNKINPEQITYKKKDVRSISEQHAYDARVFLLNQSELLDKYLHFLDIEPEVFVKLLQKKIQAFDLAPDEIKPKKKRPVTKELKSMLQYCFSLRECPLIFHYAIIILFHGIKDIK